MAVTKTHPIKSTLKAAIAYICNPAKTDGSLLVSAFGCAAETADIEFSWTHRHAIDKGYNLGRHLIQAFAPGEVTPEEAHAIGMELAKEVLGGKYEFVLTTHVDKGHIHNHLIFNSVSFVDYKYYHSNKRSYHYIRRTSDRLCKEHGLSVIVPGQDKGKTYIEHAAAKVGRSYKANLRTAVDRLIPVSADVEDLLRRLQQEGYEIKRGKFISCRAAEQERFTRLKTLGMDYTEWAIADRIAGHTRPSRKPQPRDDRIRRLYDLCCQPSRWAKLQQLKAAAKTMNFLTEHGIDNYEELEAKVAQLTASRDAALAAIKETEAKISELSLVMKYAATYRNYKPIYDSYRKSGDKEKYLRGHESAILLFEAAARELKSRGAVPLPATERMKSDLAQLTAAKEALYQDFTTARSQVKEYEILIQNVDVLLSEPQEPERPQEQHIE